jgi:hypothetical protein
MKGEDIMRKFNVWKIKEVRTRYNDLTDTATKEKDDDNDGEEAKVLVPN